MLYFYYYGEVVVTIEPTEIIGIVGGIDHSFVLTTKDRKEYLCDECQNFFYEEGDEIV